MAARQEKEFARTIYLAMLDASIPCHFDGRVIGCVAHQRESELFINSGELAVINTGMSAGAVTSHRHRFSLEDPTSIDDALKCVKEWLRR